MFVQKIFLESSDSLTEQEIKSNTFVFCISTQQLLTSIYFFAL